MVSVSSDRVRVWNARTNEALGAMQQQAPLTAFSFNANGTRLVTASLDGIARVWESQTGRPVGRPLRHLDAGRSVTTAAFSADGTRVVTASQTTAKIWDTQTGLEIHAPLLHQAQGLAAVFSADGTMRVVTASGDGTARVWDTQVGTPADSVPLADLAEALGGLRLTETDSFEPNRECQRPPGDIASTSGQDGAGSARRRILHAVVFRRTLDSAAFPTFENDGRRIHRSHGRNGRPWPGRS